MRILVSTKRFLPMLGGSIVYSLMMASEFSRKGHDVIIMTRTDGLPKTINGISVVRKPRLKRLLELAEWADVVLQVDASWRDIWPFLLNQKPWFPTIHNGKSRQKSSLSIWIANLVLAIAYQIGNTIPVGDYVAKSWNIKNKAIKNPYNDKIFNVDAVDMPREIDLLFVGRIEESKGVFDLVEALSRIQGTLTSSLKCCFVGEGGDDFRLRSVTSGLSGRIQFIHSGRLEPHEVAATMRNSRILVFPTTPLWIEASPLTPLEALACGCRIIAADSGGTRENIGPDGILIPSGDVARLAQAILSMLNDHSVRDRQSISSFLADRTMDSAADLYLQRFRASLG